MLINNQLGLFEVTSFENVQVSNTFLIFFGSPDKILLSLSLTHEIISLTKLTVTSKKPFLFNAKFKKINNH